MYQGKKVVVVMPAYNAAQTLRTTYEEVMEHEIVDLVIIVDDASRDETTAIANTLPRTRVYRHMHNRGYGGNQKSCYRLALQNGADIIVMVHPDYQYTPKLIPAMASMIASGLYSFVIASHEYASRMRDTSCVASSEWPPSSVKKSSWTPTSSTSRSSAQIAASCSSSGMRGGT